MLTVRFHRMYASGHIYSMGDGLQVIWVYTAVYTAEVINL